VSDVQIIVYNKGIAFQANLNKSEDFLVLEKPSLVYGGIGGSFIHATKTEHFLVSLLQNFFYSSLTL
jgi:hypothetical protein